MIRNVLFRRGPTSSQDRQSVHWCIVGGHPAGPAKRRREGPSESADGRAQASVGTPRLLTRGVHFDWRNRRRVEADSHEGVHSR